MILLTDIQNSQIHKFTLNEADSTLMKQIRAEQDTDSMKIQLPLTKQAQP